MRLKLLFLLIPFFVFSQQINWESRAELDANNLYHFESSYENFQSSFSKPISNKIEISLPVNSTNFESFTFIRHNPYSKELSEKFAQIKIYRGKSLSSGKIAFISFVGERINISILDSQFKTVIINSKNKNIFVLNPNIKEDEIPKSSFTNDFIEDPSLIKEKKNKQSVNNRENLNTIGFSTKLKKYRIAIITTAEWSNYFINLYDANSLDEDGKKAVVISEIGIALSGLNAVTERDLGIKFELVNNSEKLISFDESNDGLTNDDKFRLINEGAKIINDIIDNKDTEESEYDIGHTFYKGGGGLAYLGALCNDGYYKARGTSGGLTGIGFYFVFLHEMGHMMGAPHTFNNAPGFGADGNMVETGSGVTIMGYGERNERNLYYHALSLKEMNTVIQNRNCGTIVTDFENAAPVFKTNPPKLSYSIPAGTPFALGENFEISDSNNMNKDMMFNWDQMDSYKVTVNPPLNTSVIGPTFISLFPDNKQIRYFPDIETILSGNTQSEWEVVPQLTRDINFTFTVRDNNPNGGNILQEDFLVKTNYSSDGVFEVLTQHVQNLKIQQEQKIEVRWNHLAAKETVKVNIELSYDGGYTYPYMLANTIENDGNEEVTIPLLSKTKKARIRVKPTDNIFFGINPVNFEIIDPEFKMKITFPEEILCFGGVSTLSIDPKGGGGAPYTISWEKLSEDNTWLNFEDGDNDPKVLSNLVAGKYKAIVADLDGNVFLSDPITVTGPSKELKIQLGSDINKEISCVGSSDGYLNILSNGGSAPYTIFLNDQVIKTDLKEDESFKISNLKAGDYSIRVIDDNGCKSNVLNEKITEPENALYLKDFSITNPSESLNDGAIDVEIDGGTKDYTYSWTSLNFSSSDEDITNLDVGTYLLTVSDAKGCELKKEFILELDTDFNYNISITQINCWGESSGKIEAKPSGGSGGPYKIEWFDSNDILISTSSQLSNVKAGTYKLKITDSENNTYPIKTIELTEPSSSVNINLENKTDVKCKGLTTGDFNISIVGGIAPFTYYINDDLIKSNSGNTDNNTDELVQNNLKAGLYNVLVIDSKNCSKNFQVSISEPEFEIKISNEVITHLTKFDSNDGSIQISIEGGTVAQNSSYSFNWTGPNDFSSTNQNLSNLAPGKYILITKDDNECALIKEYIIKTPTDFSFTSIETTMPKCYNGKDGTISIAFEGGYGEPYIVNWFQKNSSENFVAISADSDISKTLTTVSGTYKVEVIDKENIKYQYGSEIIVGTVSELLIDVPFNIIPETCPGDKDGSFNIKIGGGTGPYSYYLNDELVETNRGNSVDNKDEFKVDNLIKKDYVFYAIDANGCMSNPINIFIDGNDPILVGSSEITKRDITCFGFNDGQIKPAITGGDGTGNYTFSWNGPNGFISSQKEITNLGDPGLYTLNVTSGLCTEKFEFDLKEPTELTAVIEELEHNLCYGDSKASMQIKIEGGTSPWLINGKYYGRKDSDTHIIPVIDQSAGEKSYTITDYYGCKTIILKPKVLQPQTALIIDQNIEGNCITEKSTLKLKMNAGDAFINSAFEEYYKVKFTGNNLNQTFNIIRDKEYIIKNLEDGNYTLEVTQRHFQESNDSQKAGCLTTQNIFISNKIIWEIKDVKDILCVNGDTPSDDGKVIYRNIRGGIPFLGDTKSYNYELVFGETVVANGSVNQNSNLTISNLKQGTYVINFKGDDGSCTSSDSFIISQPAPIAFKINQIYGSCVNPQLDVSKGAINFNVKNGTAPYELFILDNDNVSTFTGFKGGTIEEQNTTGYTVTLNGLDAGKYKIRIKDANACEFVSEEFTISVLDEFEVSNLLVYDIECFGSKNGSIDIGAIKGGAAPYTILLEGKNYKLERTITETVNNYIIKDLNKNDYKLTVQDKNGWCGTFQKEFTIKEPEIVKINILNIENQKCYDYDDGKIRIDLQGGMLAGNEASYLTKWYKNDVLVSKWNDKLEIDNLGYGFFRIDAIAKSIVNEKEVSCITTKSFEIKREERIIASENIAKHVDINCNGGNGGQFEFYFIGGAPPYKVISNGSVVKENVTENVYLFKNMLAGDYEIDIADSNDCRFSESINDVTNEVNGVIKVKLIQPEQLLNLQASIKNASCTGSDDGEVIINVSGGKPPYSINWNLERPYKELESNSKTGYFKIRTGKGSVFPTVTDVTNFCGSISSKLVISEPNALEIVEIDKKDNVCASGELGEYEIYPKGLYENIYNGQSITWYKTEDSNKIAIKDFKNIKISDDNLKASNLPKGNYLIEIKAKHFRNFKSGEEVECIITHSFEIKDPEELVINEILSEHQDIVCEAETGSIVLNIQGGSSPYKLVVNEEITDEITLDSNNKYILTGLTKGTYKITVLDKYLCNSLEVSSEIKELDPIFELTNYSDIDLNNNKIIEGNKPDCYNGLGSFYFEVSNNQASLPLNFYLDDIEIFIDKEISFEADGYLINNVSLGAKEFKVIDENGACRTISFEILNQEKIRLISSDNKDYIQQYIACSDSQDDSSLNTGIIDVTNKVVGGEKYQNSNYEYQFKWTGPNFSSDKTRIEVTSPGIYELLITDSLNCKSEVLLFDLNIDPILSNPTINNISCGGDLGSITINPSGGEAPYLVQWYKSDIEGNLNEFITNQLKIESLLPGYYTTIIVDNNGCEKIENHRLISEEIFVIEHPTIDDQLCLQESGFINIKVNNPYDTNLFFTYNNTVLDYTKLNEVKNEYVLYQVKIEDPLPDESFYVMNEYNCFYQVELNLGVGIGDFTIINRNNNEVEDFGKIPFNSQITIKNKSDGRYYAVSYDAEDGLGQQFFLRADDQDIKVNYKEEGYYTISLRLYNREGCYKEVLKTILVGKGYSFKAPNAFTPNNDGINDNYRPVFTGFVKGQLNVFSTSGIKLYEEAFDIETDFRKKVKLKGWDGFNRINGVQVYYYLFEATTLDEEKISKSGYFKVIE